VSPQTAMRNRGFTLIELLVVVVIIAAVSATVVFSVFGAERDRELRTEAMRLAQLIELARDEAVLRNRELGVQITEDGYRFVMFDSEEGRWQELDARPFQARHVSGITLVVEVEQRLRLVNDAPGQRMQPQIAIFSSGEQTPFAIELVPPSQWQAQSWFVRSDGLSRTSAARATAGQPT
jgi:general secretion pathway protein H